MSSMFDDGFDMEDATIIGGIMGFAEESIREENRQPDEIDEEPEGMPSGRSVSVTMKLLKNENPGLFAYVVKKVLEHKRKWAKAKKQREQDMVDVSGVRHELDAIERTEHLLEEDSEG